MSDTPAIVLAGRMSRQYLLPAAGPPLIDAPGGNLLYAAGALQLWGEAAGLVARVGEEYPRQWLRDLQERGFDTRGVRILAEPLDLREFIAYPSVDQPSRTNPVSHFARCGLTFPKSLLGYQPPTAQRADRQRPQPYGPRINDIPPEYLQSDLVHLCPLDFVSQTQLLAAFKHGSPKRISLDPASEYMLPEFMNDLRGMLQGLAAIFAAEQDVRALFWGQTTQLWEMAEALGSFGCSLVVIKCGPLGQLFYLAESGQRWELPAYPARLADPTGAGDAFSGGFLAGLRRTGDPLQAALHGNVAASLSVEGSGPFYPLDVLPGLAERRLESLTDLVRRA